jgi:hypothetical protein
LPDPSIHGTNFYARSLLAGHADNGHIYFLLFEYLDLNPGKFGIGLIGVLHGASYHTPGTSSALLGINDQLVTPCFHGAVALNWKVIF